MAEWSGFFDAHKVGDSWDRTYLAEDFAKFFAPLIGNGIFAGRSNELQVFQAVPSGMYVVLSSGQSWIEGYGYINDSDLLIPVDPADGALGRIDRIVNQWSSVDRRIRTVWKKGTPAVNPVAPPLQWNADYKELNICTIDVSAGLSAITQDKIHDTRMDSSVCGWVTSLIEQVDTSTLYIQWEAQAELVLNAIQKELADLEAGVGVELRKLQFNNIEIPSNFFLADTKYADYPLRAAVALDGVIASMIPEVIFALPDTVSGNFAPVAESYNGGVYIYAAEIPETDVTIPTIVCWRGDSIGVGTTNAGGSGGMSMELLWENASPSSAFSGQTIALDLSKYRSIRVHFYPTSTGTKNEYRQELDVGSRTLLVAWNNILSNGASVTAECRQVVAKEDSVVFNDARAKVVTSTSATDTNTAVIPFAIYGIK